MDKQLTACVESLQVLDDLSLIPVFRIFSIPALC